MQHTNQHAKDVTPIDRIDELRLVMQRFEGVSQIAIDTEFTRRRTFFSQLELVQLICGSTEACIDARQCGDLSELSNLLGNDHVEFIFHSASQDLDALARHVVLPRRVFDTQIAAVICGLGELSFQRLVDHVTGVSLGKGATRSDWSRRPLTADQLRYAMDDVRYLLPVYESLSARLDELGRTHWLRQECDWLVSSAVRLRDADPDQAWKSFKMGEELKACDQHVARDLLIWRERRARSRDLPRQWVMRDHAVISVVERPPRSVGELSSRHGVGSGRPVRWAQDIVDIANRSRDPSLEAVWRKSARFGDRERKFAKRLLAIVGAVSSWHEIPASLLCSRSDAEKLAAKGRNVRLLTGWRHEIAGEAIAPLLDQIESG